MVVVAWYLWGLNPRRLVCLADLKSAALDHSGKIPRQIDTHAPARKKSFYCVYNDIYDQSNLFLYFIDAYLHCMSVRLCISRPDSRQNVVYSENKSPDHFYHTLLDLAWQAQRLLSKLLADDIKLFDSAIVLDITTRLQRAARICTVRMGGQQVIASRCLSSGEWWWWLGICGV